MSGVIKLVLFVLHSEKLASRKPMVEALVAKLRANKQLEVDVQWITEHEPEGLAAAHVQQVVSLTKTGQVPLFDDLVKNLHVRQVSNALKHHEALRRAATADADFALIVEDDVAFGDDVDAALLQVLRSQMTKTQDEAWDVLFLGQPSLTAVPASGRIDVLPALDQFKVLPACDSYVLSPASAAKVLARFLPVRFQTNVQWSFLLEAYKQDIVAKRTLPNILLDGSKLGVYVSTLEPTSRLLFNGEYTRLAQLVKKPVKLSPDEEQEVQRLLQGMRFKGHPDVVYLQALQALRVGQPAKAHELMSAAYKLYEDNHAIMNNESEFLAAYIDVHKHVQSFQSQESQQSEQSHAQDAVVDA